MRFGPNAQNLEPFGLNAQIHEIHEFPKFVNSQALWPQSPNELMDLHKDQMRNMYFYCECSCASLKIKNIRPLSGIERFKQYEYTHLMSM
jgi:hypothetical protein